MFSLPITTNVNGTIEINGSHFITRAITDANAAARCEWALSGVANQNVKKWLQNPNEI